MNKKDIKLFTNDRLNQMFCSRLEDSQEFCNHCIECMSDTLDLHNKMGSKNPVEDAILQVVIAYTETAFEMGFKMAMEELAEKKKTRDASNHNS